MNTERQYPMPALTEQERADAIAFAERELMLYGSPAECLQAKIVLAALTAEPEHAINSDGTYISKSEAGDLWPECVEVAVSLLYAAPPVPVLKPIELPGVEKWRSVDQVRAQMSYRHLVADSLIGDGYGVKE